MYCPKCGSAVDNSAAYCNVCGALVEKASSNAETSSKNLKSKEKQRLPLSTLVTGLVAVFAILGLLFALVSRTQGTIDHGVATTEGDFLKESPTFATPEDAVRHFYEALVANDFGMALEACAVREQAEGFDFPGSVDRLKTHMPMINMAPSTSEMFLDINDAATAGTFANQMKMLIYSFFVTEGMDGTPVTPADREYAEAFQAMVNPRTLKDLKLLSIDPPMASMLESDKNIENFNKAARIYGAEEHTERIVLYELNGETYMGGFGLYRYASGWKICRFNSILAGQPSYGTAIKMTSQQYEGLK